MTSRRRNQPSRKPESEDNGNVSLTEATEVAPVVEEVLEPVATEEETILTPAPEPEPVPEPKIVPAAGAEAPLPAKGKPPKRAERIRQPRNVPKFSMLKGH